MKPKSNKSYITIGELVKKFNKYYPDLTRSKLRFLELKGLILPKRSENKYRIYFKDDVKKIYFILKMQKDYYMPLEVIKKKLGSVDFKKISRDEKFFKGMQLKLGEKFKPYKSESLSIDSLKKKYKLSQTFVDDLLENSIVDLKEEDGKYIIDIEDIEIIKILGELSKFGIQVRHLKLFENFASRHSLFIQQIILPLLKSSSKKSHRKASKLMSQLEENLCNIHSLLVKRKNRKFLEKYK